uniref:Putative site-specific DNA endonuclease n=1 Tax=Pleodorina starrii TaxID=330485 RepID=M9P860_9CHLO|nr:putative site-specific DNA endonuclease [Pleodorina starrii]AFY64450.1 putative site-specific DNA endonuclease [Pleodorina starrii]QLL26241.1 putative site-specific DNA endonuclease [Pleodorina starrii]QLL26243.1 putative site-specific DNA endonuclease [Pleodorina starrii]QLL26245.1 putative site-specific DNA endonuclease [Pleodorina starrii]QLL26247.1 putative site-specific DNA endonuclease [Pleodorina starrii]
MLRGSFSLVLTEEQMDFLDSIAKKAFMGISSHGLFPATSLSEPLNTIHLTTDPSKIQNGRPGVYIIKHVKNGMCKDQKIIKQIKKQN